MSDKLTKQQLLDFAAAEGIFRERLSTLGNLAKVLGLACHAANVLRFIFEEGGCHREVDLDLPRIAGLPWVQSSENTVRRRPASFWEQEGIIEIERDRRRGLPGPQRCSLAAGVPFSSGSWARGVPLVPRQPIPPVGV